MTANLLRDRQLLRATHTGWHAAGCGVPVRTTTLSLCSGMPEALSASAALHSHCISGRIAHTRPAVPGAKLMMQNLMPGPWAVTGILSVQEAEEAGVPARMLTSGWKWAWAAALVACVLTPPRATAFSVPASHRAVPLSWSCRDLCRLPSPRQRAILATPALVLIAQVKDEGGATPKA
ncbi:MAG: hypothetical protein ACPIOQ_34555, partial [Promethearchaeia archaeon]